MNNREIDALIAEHVFDFIITAHPELYTRPADDREYLIPNYSTDIAAAYGVMTKMYDYGIRIDTAGGRVDKWAVRFTEYKVRAVHQSLPMAICLAVLKLKGVEVDGL